MIIRAAAILLFILCSSLTYAQIRPLCKAKSSLIESSIPFGPDATIKLDEDGDPATGNVLRCKSESGIINGIAYSVYYTDGSGKFTGTPGNKLGYMEPMESNWFVACNKDPINDTKSCYMKRGDLWVWVFKNDKLTFSTVRIGHDHYPGSDVTLRIDKDTPLSINSRLLNGSFPPTTSERIISRLSKAKTVTTRFQEWPSGYPTATWEVYGFNEALAYIKWAIARIK